MSHVEITLKNGVTIMADVSKWTTQKNGLGRVIGYEWEHGGPRRLTEIDVDEVVAAVFVATDDD